jgi:hypothetical protein
MLRARARTTDSFRRSFSLLFLSALLFSTSNLSSAAEESEAQGTLARMAEQFNELRSLHTRTRVQEIHADEERHYEIEAWLDVSGQRVRCEIRDLDRPTPHLTFFAHSKGLVVHSHDARQFGQQRMDLPFAMLLPRAMVGELWSTAVAGDLRSMKRQAFGSVTIVAAEETVQGVACQVLAFAGNQEARLWVSLVDGLPRRLRGPLSGHLREEEVEFLERNPKLEDSLFRVSPGPGEKVLPLAIAQTQWMNLPHQSSRWPQAGSMAPAFETRDLKGRSREFPGSDREPSVLAFWFLGSEEVEAKITAAEKLLIEDAHRSIRLSSVLFADSAKGLRKQLDTRRFRHEIWTAGEDSAALFARYGIAACPVFVLTRKGGEVIGCTRQIAELEALLDEL